LKRLSASPAAGGRVDWLSPLVKNCENGGEITAEGEVDGVWKLAEQRAMNRLNDKRELGGILTNPVEHDIELRDEALSDFGSRRWYQDIASSMSARAEGRTMSVATVSDRSDTSA
jgi:hypothetical protein